MKELVGKVCRCIFALPFHEWPVAGYPAWVMVLAVDMPMVKLSARDNEVGAVWVHVDTIQQISVM